MNHQKPNKFIDISQFNLIAQKEKTHKKKKKSKSKRQSASSQQQLDQTVPNNQQQHLNDMKSKHERQEQKIMKKLMKIQLKKENHEKILMKQNLNIEASPRKYEKFVKYDQVNHKYFDSILQEMQKYYENLNQTKEISSFKNKLPPRPPFINDFKPIINLTRRDQVKDNGYNNKQDFQQSFFKNRQQKLENDLKDNQFPLIMNASQNRNKTPRDM